MDWLSLREWMEMRLEDVESFLRRHQRTLYALAALAALAAGAWLYPAAARETAATRPRLQTVALTERKHPPAPKSHPRDRRPPAARSTSVPLSSLAGGPTYCWIQVAGAVVRPGIYRVPAGTRGFQVVKAAGGLLPEADLSRVNLARRLADESLLVVPTRDAAPAPTPQSRRGKRAPDDVGTPVAPDLPPTPLDLNQAASGQLMGLPGIGPALARAIVADRTVRGPFRTAREIMRVPRVGLRLFERIQPYIYVRGERTYDREGGAARR